MPLSQQQKNIYIDVHVNCGAELVRISDKMDARKDQFISEEGGKVGDTVTDLTALTVPELKTKLITFGKLRGEILNIESNLYYEIQRVDKEIISRS